MSLKSKNITSTYDLADKRIMFRLSFDDAGLMAMMTLVGVDSDNYIHISQNYDDMALIKDDVDVIFFRFSSASISSYQRFYLD
ncbi:MAG: hypothetical protein ACJAXS_000342 [Colwellia sp.]